MQQDIQLSKYVIQFSKDKKFTLQITNKSSTKAFVFKIKTTKLNTYQVKPPLGFVMPGEKKNIQFKIVSPLSPQEVSESISRDKFQLQFLSGQASTIPKSKQQFKTYWDQAKNDPNKEDNLLNFTCPVLIQDDRLQTVISQPFSPIKIKGQATKPDFKNTNVKKSFTLQGQFNKPQKSDQQLSSQFQKLKQKQQRLLLERQSIYKQQPKITQKSSKSTLQIVLIIIAFLISIMIGNFLKLRVFVEEEPL